MEQNHNTNWFVFQMRSHQLPERWKTALRITVLFCKARSHSKRQSALKSRTREIVFR